MSNSTGDPVPSIPEANATGEIAVLYADIRATLGVPVVNLIWRNLAAMPGALAWAWNTVKPLHVDGSVHDQARALRMRQQVPDVPALPRSALRSAGVDGAGEATIRVVLDTYDRSNPLNLVSLSAMLAVLEGTASTDSTRPPAPSAAEAPDEGALPKLLNLDEMTTDAAQLVHDINELGARGRSHILVSMPRHLAHWPGFLALYWMVIAPFDRNGTLHELIDAVLEEGRQRGTALAQALAAAGAPPDDIRDSLTATLDDFSRNAIARMIPVVSLLKQAMPREE